MALIVGVWVIAFLCFSGVGALFRHLLGVRARHVADWFADFWVGWAAVVGFLQLWNLWLPITGWALAVVILGGVAGIALSIGDAGRKDRPRVTEFLGPGIVWILLAALTSLEASGPLTDGASGDYQLASVAWAKAFPVVRGLGNLFPRLAFNQSFFLYEALLDVGPFAQNSYQLANGLLQVVVLGQCLWGLRQLLRDQDQVHLRDVYFSLMLGPVLIQITDERFRSLSADPGLFFLGVALFGLLVEFVCDRKGGEESSESTLLQMLLMAAVGIACKLSFSGFAMGAMLVALGVYWVENRDRLKVAWSPLGARGAGVVVLILAPWMVRGFLLSGYPAFPSTVAGLPVEWRVPPSLAEGELSWIQLRARNPGVPAAEATPTRKWLGPWIKSLPNSVVKPVEITACLLLFLAVALRRTHWRARFTHAMLLLVVPLVGLWVWFFAAPDPRFAGASFWILLVSVLLVALLVLFDVVNPAYRRVIVGLCLFFLVWVSPFTSYQPPGRLRDLLVPTRTERVPAYQTITLNSGDRVNVVSPLVGCWDIPLPCTDNFHVGLELLTSGQIAHGFKLVGSP